MASLLADGWFYISAGGFLVSAVLFIFLLGQYRSAVEADDEAEAAVVEPVRPIRGPQPSEVPPSVRSVEPVKLAETPKPASVESKPPADEPKPVSVEPKPAATLSPGVIERRKSETTGGVSPAVVYMQNLKLQIDHLDKEILALKTLASQHAAQSDAVLKRLAEMGSKVDKTAAAPAPEIPIDLILARLADLSAKVDKIAVAPVAAQEETPTPAPETQPVAPAEETPPAPVAEAQPEPVAAEPASPDATVAIDPKEITLQSVPEPAPSAAPATVELRALEAAPATEEAPTEPKPARKGPVWPI